MYVSQQLYFQDNQSTYQDGMAVDIPLAVLVNGNTASAAEVMTAFVFGYKDLALLDPSFYTRDIKNILLAARQEFRNFFKGKIVIVAVAWG